VAKILGYHCPSFPLKRQISIFDCRDLDLSPYGMFIDTSGVYFHPEASNGLCGLADPTQQSGYDFQYDGESFFQEKIWLPLYERSSAFERLRHLTGWAGLYEVSPDHSAIIGEVSQGLYEIHSFSGHGVMQSYAAARGLVEWILYKKYQTLDLSPFSGKRFSENKPLQNPETWVI
jgi:sarcosine oxidase